MIGSSPVFREMAVAVAICYFVVIGGTAIGEVHPVIRAINGVAGGALILGYLARAPRQADWFDRRMLIALLLFGGAAVLSSLPRQSFDALLSALAMVAAIFVLRGVVARDHARRLLIVTLRSLSLGLTALFATLWLGVVGSWVEVTGELVLPIGITLQPATWGHQYDAALLLLLLLPSWFVAPRSRASIAIGTALAVVISVLAVLSGSRSVWLAVLLATSAVVVMPYATDPSRRRLVVTLLAAGLIAAAVIAFSPFGPPLIQRLAYTSTLELRAEMWTTVAEAWSHRPFAGFGPGSFPWLLQTTDWFDTNTAAPIHPDNIVVHALGEGGLLGLAALGVLVSTVPRAWTSSSAPVRWVFATFAIACLGTNPPAFAFFIAVIGIWVAYALPRTDVTPRSAARPWRSVAAMRAVAVLAVGVAIVFGSMTLAHVSHAIARSHAEAGRYDEAEGGFAVATALDPSMGMYWRDLGIDRWFDRADEAALDDLATALRINPWDDLTWRAAAVIRLERQESALAVMAAAAATDIQRSDVANILLAIAARTSNGTEGDARELLAELVQAWPLVTGAPGWPELRGPHDGPELMNEALRRWADGAPSPVRPGYEQVWLQAVVGETVDVAGTPSPAVAEAMVAAMRCDPSTEEVLGAVRSADLLWPEYWEARMRAAANEGLSDPDARIGYMLTSHLAIQQQDPEASLNPLTDGQWAGYRRIPTFWPNAVPLPSPEAGRMRWALLPGDAMESAEVADLIVGCQFGP